MNDRRKNSLSHMNHDFGRIPYKCSIDGCDKICTGPKGLPNHQKWFTFRIRHLFVILLIVEKNSKIEYSFNASVVQIRCSWIQS